MADSSLEQTRLKAQIDADAAKRLAEVNAEAAERLAEVAAQAAVRAARVDYDKAYFQEMLDAAKSALDRWRSAAELVQKSAAAIGTLYAGILGVTFSVSSRALPIRGVVPALFLGLAIAMSTVYVAYGTHGAESINVPPPTAPVERLRFRLNTFIGVVQEAVDRRVYWLRASVLALGAGVLFLPAPFIAWTSTSPPNLADFAWPSPQPVTDAADASVVSIVYKAQVDEIAARRQRAEAGQDASADLGIWAGLTGAAVAAVLLLPLIPRMTRRRGTGSEGDTSDPPLPYAEL